MLLNKYVEERTSGKIKVFNLMYEKVSIIYLYLNIVQKNILQRNLQRLLNTLHT